MLNEKLILIALGVSAIAAAAYLLYRRPSRLHFQQDLYMRLGGVFSIAAVINHFSDALIDNPVVGRNSANPQLADWHTNQLHRLPGLKFMRTLWVCSISGGPFVYSPTKPGKCPFSLENAHSKFNITPEEFNAVAEELDQSLRHFSVPDRERNEVLAAFKAHGHDITFKYDHIHNINNESCAAKVTK